MWLLCSQLLLIAVVSGRQFTRALPDAPGRFESSGPAINGSYDLTDEKSPGETLVLSCRWTSEVRWILPDNTGYQGYTTFSGRSNTSGRYHELYYESILVVKNLVAADTGEFICQPFNEDSKDTNIKNATAYIFVSGMAEESLFLKKKEALWVMLRAGYSGYINCRVTVPSAQPKLKSSANNEDFTNYGIYDPRYGFLWDKETTEKLSYKFKNLVSLKCEVDYEGIKDTLPLLVIIHGKRTTIKDPVVRLVDGENPYQGGNMTVRCEEDFVDYEQVFGTCSWQFPARSEMESCSETEDCRVRSFDKVEKETVVSTLFVSNLRWSGDEGDQGYYTCTCEDPVNNLEASTTFYVEISATKGQIRKFELVTIPMLNGAATLGSTITFRAVVDAWPDPQFRWIKEYQTVTNGTVSKVLDEADGRISMMEVFMSSPKDAKEKSIKILDLQLSDSGNYSLEVTADTVVQKRTIPLFVKSSPSVTIAVNPDVSTRFLQLNEHYELTCAALGYPIPSITWQWKPCLSDQSCPWSMVQKSFSSRFLNYAAISSEQQGTFEKIVTLSTTANGTGTYQCVASNSIPPPMQFSIEYIVTDVRNSSVNRGLEILPNTTEELYEGDSITLSCKSQKFDYIPIKWHRINSNDGSDVPLDIMDFPSKCGNHCQIVEDNSSPYSNHLDLKISPLSISNNGMYKCVGVLNDMRLEAGGPPEERFYNLSVKKVELPLFLTSQHPENLIANYSEKFDILCQPSGKPDPDCSWYKDGKELAVTTTRSGVELTDGKRYLRIHRVLKEDAGLYSCRAANRFGSSFWNFTLSVQGGPDNEPKTSILLGTLLGCLGLTVVVLMLIIVILKRRERKRMDLLKELYRQLMASAEYQPKLDPDLPIHEQAENLPFNIKFEVPKDRLRTGNVLGQGQFGKVLEGQVFLDEQKSVPTQVAVKVPRDGMNYSHQKALLDELKIMIYIGKHVNVLGLIGCITRHMVKGELYVIMEYCKYGSLDHYLAKRRITFINELLLIRSSQVPQSSNDGYLTPDSLAQSGKADVSCYQGELDPDWSRNLDSRRHSGSFLSTSDLLAFSYQIANGMEYLVSRNLLHRDLAARNVLVSSEQTVKICDFGLARFNENYQIKKVNVPLPVRWMALESIRYKEYTNKSDVWSFAVLMWEIFTLGETPYPGIQEIDQSFVEYLKNGNRMSQPPYSPDEVYTLMRKCWLSDADQRPNFTECKSRLGEQLRACNSDRYDSLIILLEKGTRELGEPPNYQNLHEEQFNQSKTSGTLLHGDTVVLRANSSYLNDSSHSEPSQATALRATTHGRNVYTPEHLRSNTPSYLNIPKNGLSVC